MQKCILHIICCVGILLGMSSFHRVQAQGQVKSVMFTGRIVGGKSAQALPRTYIFIPKAGRGTLSDESGYFAIPVFPGDSVMFSYLGFQRQYHVIPRRLDDESYSALIMMKDDIKTLAEVKVYPYSTEEEFKKAFVEMRLPDEAAREALEKNTNKEYLMLLASAQAPANGMMNYRNFMNQQLFGRESITNRGSVTTFPFLDPFAIARFISSVKRGDLKKNEYRKFQNQAPPENVKRGDILKQ